MSLFLFVYNLFLIRNLRGYGLFFCVICPQCETDFLGTSNDINPLALNHSKVCLPVTFECVAMCLPFSSNS